jgi:radical SAM superfamily enzyme YgiQ (UPF0313 family)
MKITIINVTGRLSSDGSRLISALLKKAGHDVKTIFLARPEPLNYDYTEIRNLDPILKDSELVMLAVYSSYAIRAVQITQYIKKYYPALTVIWGGPHCIAAPELVLPHADGVCFSEGDSIIVDFVNKLATGKDYWQTPSMAFNREGRKIINPPSPPVANLDDLPFSDYDLDQQFLLDEGLIQMTKAIVRDRMAGYPYYIPILYFTTSRGCPHSCSYCNNIRFIEMFGGNYIRRMSVDRILDELEFILSRLDFLKFIGFGDDDFLLRSLKDLKDLAGKYKSRIGLPFGIAFSANTFHKEKLSILLDAGLKAVQIGVQSGSQRVLDEVYSRRVKVARVREVLNQMESYHDSHHLDILVDMIIDNPYETRDDIRQSFQFLINLPLWMKINIFYLNFFPGTPLYTRALCDGFIEPFNEETSGFFTRNHLRFQKNYDTLLIQLLKKWKEKSGLRLKLSLLLLRFLGMKGFRKIASGLPSSFYSALFKTDPQK